MKNVSLTEKKRRHIDLEGKRSSSPNSWLWFLNQAPKRKQGSELCAGKTTVCTANKSRRGIIFPGTKHKETCRLTVYTIQTDGQQEEEEGSK